MGATGAVLLTLLNAGDHLLTDNRLRGETEALLRRMARLGVRISRVDMTDLGAVRAAMTGKTKVLYLEAPSGPAARAAGIRGCADAAHRCGALLVVEAAFAPQPAQSPLALGADICIRRAAKCGRGYQNPLSGRRRRASAGRGRPAPGKRHGPF